MSRTIDISTVITLRSMGRDVDFRIEEHLGKGGSCVAYIVTYNEADDISHRGVLKEFCPAYLESSKEFSRDEKGLVIPEGLKDRFSDDLQRFRNVYRDINKYLYNNVSASKYHPVQLGLYEGNNTLYTLVSCESGGGFEKLDVPGLYSNLKILHAVATAVEMYHSAGFLHLDIKPKNIFILDGVYDVIKLFDFDSLTPMSVFKTEREPLIPVPEDYYVPELNEGNVRGIGVQTDIFELGAMLFLRMFGRAPEIKEMNHRYRVDVDASEMTRGISPKAKYELQVLFSKTVQIAKASRYRSISELKKQIEKIIELVSPGHEVYLPDMPKWQPSAYAVGRGAELKDINNRLEKDGYVFIKAIGGLGKSELAKMYVQSYAHKYHTVQFCKYTDSLRAVTAALTVKGINDDEYKDFDELVKEKNKILHESDEQTLLIVDNYNVTHDDFLRDFLPAGNKSFKVIFTSRCMPAATYYKDKVLELERLSEGECEYLFCKHASPESFEPQCFEELLELIDRNTLILVLLASALNRTGMSLEEMTAKLKDQKLSDVQVKIYHDYDISNEEVRAYNRISSHLNTIFSVSKLSDTEKEILKNMTLVSSEGITVKDFTRFCAEQSITPPSVEALVAQGWIQKQLDDSIVMHPIVSDVLAGNEDIKKCESYYNLAEYLQDVCVSDYNGHITEMMKKLSCALQLNRRYISETHVEQAIIKTSVGRLYEAIYRPKEARKYLFEALDLEEANKSHYFTACTYHILGMVEENFGTLGDAIKYYRLSVSEGKRAGRRDCETVVGSMISIAECLAENSNVAEAYKQYKAALSYARLYSLKGHIAKIADGLVFVCNSLEWKAKAEKYKKLKNKYMSVSEDVEELQPLTYVESMTAGDYDSSLRQYEEFLKEKREVWGEESPLYKDIARNRWGLYLMMGDKGQAIRFSTEDLEFVEKTFGRESVEMAKQLSLRAELFPSLGEYGYSYDCAVEAISILDRLKEQNSYLYTETKLALAKICVTLSRRDEAKKVIDSIDFGEYTGSDALASFMNTSGIVLCECSEYEKVERMCDEFLKRKNADALYRTQAFILKAVCNEQRGNTEQAEKYLEEAFGYINEWKPSLGKDIWLAQYYRTKARIYYRRLDCAKAIENIDILLKLFLGDHRNDMIMFQSLIERGLYYAKSGNYENADKDYKECERILKDNNMPDGCYIILYNNIADQKILEKKYDTAKEYLDKIVKIDPDIVEPETYFEAVVCNNIGWIASNAQDYDKAERFLTKAAEVFIKVKADGCADYGYALFNLALLYERKEDYKKSLAYYDRLFKLYTADDDVTGNTMNEMDACCVRTMLKADKVSEAYTFAQKREKLYGQWYGDLSVQRVHVLTVFGSFFKQYGRLECLEFFTKANDAIKSGKLENTVYYARILNYFGVYFCDMKADYDMALSYFKRAKKLFDKLGAYDDVCYAYIEPNIEYVENIKKNGGQKG